MKATNAAPERRAVELFISYAPEDEAFSNNLQEHLASLQAHGIITIFECHDVDPGKDVQEVITERMSRTDIVLLLVSASFLASDPMMNSQVALAMERHAAGKTIVIPILIRPCDWSGTIFAHLEPLPRGGRPVASWENHDQALTEIAKAVRIIATNWGHRKPRNTSIVVPLPPRPGTSGWHRYRIGLVIAIAGVTTVLALLRRHRDRADKNDLNLGEATLSSSGGSPALQQLSPVQLQRCSEAVKALIDVPAGTSSPQVRSSLSRLSNPAGLEANVSLTGAHTAVQFTDGRTSIQFREDTEGWYNFVASDGGIVQVEPQVDYLSRLNNGGPISMLRSQETPFADEFELPTIDFKIVNNSHRTVLFTEAIFDVERSTPDPWPVPMIQTSAYSMSLHINNAGWGEMRDTLLYLKVNHPGESLSFDGPFVHRIELGTIVDREKNVDLHDIFGALGVNLAHVPLPLDSLMKLSPADTSWLGPYKDGCAVLIGEIGFIGDTADGKTRSSNVKFAVELNLWYDPGPGGFLGIGWVSNVRLLSHGSHYSLSTPLSQALKSGDIDRFAMVMSAPQSSLHNFRIGLRYNGTATLWTPPLSMKMFIPRREAQSIVDVHGKLTRAQSK